jgi:hypothetical protein
MTSGQGLEGVSNPLANMCYLQKLPIPSGKLARGLPITSKPYTNLSEGCQYPLAPCNKYARGLRLPTTYGTFARGLPQLHTKGQPFCNTPEEIKIQK